MASGLCVSALPAGCFPTACVDSPPPGQGGYCQPTGSLTPGPSLSVLQVLGFEIDAVNSVQFSNHTGKAQAQLSVGVRNVALEMWILCPHLTELEGRPCVRVEGWGLLSAGWTAHLSLSPAALRWLARQMR